MNRKTLAAGVAALALVAAAPLMATAEPGHGGKHGHAMKGGHHAKKGGHHGMRHTARFLDFVETYDADGDGSVSQEEIDSQREARLREFDEDGDGQLSLDEYEALWLDAMRERMVRQFQRHDDDGDGQVTVDEFGDRMSRLVVLRDRNGDGVLNMDDLRRGRDRDPRGDRPAAPAAGEQSEGEQQ